MKWDKIKKCKFYYNKSINKKWNFNKNYYKDNLWIKKYKNKLKKKYRKFNKIKIM
jgi:hypothetical protein